MILLNVLNPRRGGVMKNLKVFIIALLTVVFAASAHAASLSHTPDYASLTIPSGASDTVPITVSIADADGTYYLWYVDTVDGNLPLEWITAADATTFLSSIWDSDSTDLTISVPATTAPGTYSGRLYSKGMKSHVYADPGPGMLIEVTVSSTVGCAGVPVVEITDVRPNIIWPPNHSMEVVTVSGTVTNPSGCALAGVSYSIEDEYGIHTGAGEVTVNGNGEFTVPIPVEAWRRGQDKDGRHYKIQIFAENDAGTGSSVELEAVVPHDRGKCPKN
jgi:hypothetical protein